MKRLEKKKSDFRKDPKLERLFIALQPPLELRRAMARNNAIFQKEQRNIRFVEQDQLHLTLKFLGSDVSPESREQIVELFNELAGKLPAPVVRIEELQFGFPRQMLPRILFYNIAATPSMQNLTSIVHERLMELELPDIKREKDYKKMVYHLTIGRVKHHSHRSYGRKIREMIKNEAQPINEQFVPSTMYLIRSRLHHRSDPRYDVVAEFPLTAPLKQESHG